MFLSGLVLNHQQFYLSLHLYHQSKHLYRQKKKKKEVLFAIIKVVLTCRYPERISGAPTDLWTTLRTVALRCMSRKGLIGREGEVGLLY